ncbi:MAG: tetratricopeptide repeat protein [Candidatus Omnitrophica bacterium]|nr:tetratricopeptide repeat protein [Candidatus Omnitrophota bacterium]
MRLLIRYPLLLIVAACFCYANSFSGPFIFDDFTSIVQNPHIRSLWPLWGPFLPPPQAAEAWRPLTGFTFALNYAISAREVWSYHLFNLLIHISCGLLLFGLMRRTFRAQKLRGAFEGRVELLSFGCALLWLVHPLQTQAVNYIVQRGESLAGLFYLLIMYGLMRGAQSERRARAWHGLALAAVFLGGLSKPVVLSAPLLALLYDRVFLSFSWREVWEHRRRFYGMFLILWTVPLLLLALSPAVDKPSMGFDVPGISASLYALTQTEVLSHYGQLVVWPRPLVFDYAWPLAQSLSGHWPYVLSFAGFLLVVVWALFTSPALGFLGAGFLLLLSVSSSFIPIADLAAEHRMYLALAPALAGCVLFLDLLIGELVRSHSLRKKLLLLGISVWALGLASMTLERNSDYRSDLSIWSDTVAKRPENARAHNNLGEALMKRGQVKAAVQQYIEAITLRPTYALAHNNLGHALLKLGRPGDSLAQIDLAVDLDPLLAEAHNNRGTALYFLSRLSEAETAYRTALGLNPALAEAHNNLGLTLMRMDRPAAAVAAYREALRYRPGYAEAQHNLGAAFANMGQLQEAIEAYQEAIRLDPDYARAYNNLGNVFFHQGRYEEAALCYEEVLRLDPNHAKAHYNLGLIFLKLDKPAQAKAAFERALQIDPDYVKAKNFLAPPSSP